MASRPSTTTKGFRDDRYRALIGALVEARQGQGLTQKALAEKIGRHQQFVSRFETGERRLDVVEFADVAHALQLDLAQMLARHVKPHVIKGN